MVVSNNGAARASWFGALGLAGSRQTMEPAKNDSPSPISEGHRLASAASSNPSRDHAGALPPISRLLALDADQHARELLAWLQGPGGRTGSLSARDLAAAHRDMCEALDIEPMGWVAVGRELRRLLGEPKRYVDRGRRRTRTYRIPPAGAEFESMPRAAARWAPICTADVIATGQEARRAG